MDFERVNDQEATNVRNDDARPRWIRVQETDVANHGEMAEKAVVPRQRGQGGQRATIVAETMRKRIAKVMRFHYDNRLPVNCLQPRCWTEQLIKACDREARKQNWY